MTSPTGIETDVALKVLRRDVAPGSQAVSRLKDEGKMLARLAHPAILKVHDLVVLEGRVTLVTEYIEGEDLEQCIRSDEPLGLRALLEAMSQVAAALDAADDELGIAHRDIKPANIRISKHGDVKVLDFGIARTDEMTREARTATDMLIGSPPYMAPERFLDGEPRSASDVFAVGAVLWEGLVGRRMFDLSVPVLATHAVDPTRYATFISERLAEADGPPEVVALIEACVAYGPDDRPSAAEVARRCDHLADEVGGESMARWARARAWPESGDVAGELEGRSLSEDAGVPAPPPPPPTSAPSVRQVLGVSFVSFTVLMAVLFTIGGAGAIYGTWLYTQESTWEAESTEKAEPVPEPDPQPPPPDPNPEAPPEPSPERRPDPVRAPQPPPDPPTVFVATSGDVVPVLVRGEDAVELPAEVPPGTWAVHARFGGRDPVDADETLEVREGGHPVVTCSERLGTCSVK